MSKYRVADPAAEDSFGAAVALDGGLAVIGADQRDDRAPNAGAMFPKLVSAPADVPASGNGSLVPLFALALLGVGLRRSRGLRWAQVRLQTHPMRKRAVLSAGLITLVACFEQDPKVDSDASGGRSSSGGADTVAGDSGDPEPSTGGRNDPARGGRSASGGLAAVSGSPAIAGSPAKVTGAACENDEDCVALDGGPGRCDTSWPNGYCASICATFLDCAGGESAVCREIADEWRCLTGCFAPSDCREGYHCDEELYACIPE